MSRNPNRKGADVTDDASEIFQKSANYLEKPLDTIAERCYNKITKTKGCDLPQEREKENDKERLFPERTERSHQRRNR